MTPNPESGTRVLDEPATVSNARLIAELQAVTIGIHLVGLDRLLEIARSASTPSLERTAAA